MALKKPMSGRVRLVVSELDVYAIMYLCLRCRCRLLTAAMDVYYFMSK
jgi:hypothetical protein